MMAASRLLRRARFARACWWLAFGCILSAASLSCLSSHAPSTSSPVSALIKLASPTGTSPRRRWFLNILNPVRLKYRTDANLGVVLGGSTGLSVADWDDASAYRDWRATLGATVVSLTERSARGYHVFFFAPGLSSATNGACEFKAHGACMVAPSIHPSGARYRLVHPAPLATLDGCTARSLFPFLSDAADSSTPPPFANSSHSLAHTGLIARIKAARPILDELHDAGVELHPAGHHTLVGRCPFHDDHTPSLWVYPDSDLWGCNRPDCPAAGTHDVINFRARWRSISNRTAIRLLADEYL